MARMRKGSLASVRCPCGWHGTRCLTTTQPCPSCGAQIDTLAARAAQRAANRRHDEAKRQAATDARIDAATRRSTRLADEQAALDRAAALLRADTEHLRPARKAP